jgi:hypothetical protein
MLTVKAIIFAFSAILNSVLHASGKSRIIVIHVKQENFYIDHK